MDERSRVMRVVEDAAGELLKALTHPHVHSVPVVDSIETMEVSPVAGEVSKEFPLAIDTVLRDVKLGVRICSLERMKQVEAGLVLEGSKFETHCKEMQIVEPEKSECRQVECLPGQFRSNRMTGFGISPERAKSAMENPIRGRVVRHFIRTMVPDWVKKETILKGVRAVRDINMMCEIPVQYEAVPWNRLDRKIILACWELLRGQAVEELGRDPGRDLEMLAVYLNVRPELFRGSGFDPSTRTLSLYPKYADSQRDKIGDSVPAPYAIIIGAVRGTVRLLQASLRISPDTD